MCVGTHRSDLSRKTDRSWREGIVSDVERWWEIMAKEAAVQADPVNPMLLFAELSPRLPDAIITADSGSAANWYARLLRFRCRMRGSLSGNLATMGPGVPYGIGAKFGAAGLYAVVAQLPRRDVARATALADALLADTATDCLHPDGRWKRAPDDPPVGCRTKDRDPDVVITGARQRRD